MRQEGEAEAIIEKIEKYKREEEIKTKRYSQHNKGYKIYFVIKIFTLMLNFDFVVEFFKIFDYLKKRTSLQIKNN